MARPRKSDSTEPPLSRREVAAFISDVSGELALLAGRARWPLLTGFLNMARVEADARLAAENAAISLNGARKLRVATNRPQQTSARRNART